jgi:Ca-activated chloride channel family protein
MNLNQLDFWPGLLALFFIFVLILFILEKRFFAFVRRYWFFKRSLLSYLSSVSFILGIGLLLFSLLDLRGPEEKIKAEVPKNRTIILIDTSASMLSEDVKPSRLQKAALIAKHFARKAAGEQLSVVAFAEVQKKIVPFTNDLDLIDARLDSLKGLRNHYGSSALSLAIQESIQYFKESDGNARGNILVLTDGEETAEGIRLSIPVSINIAFVGVGTTQGGRIPLDDARGFRFGYKRDNSGKEVVTKLNEAFFRKTVADLPSAKYWIANSYSLPSEEILEFFSREKAKAGGSQDMVIKPVLMELIVIPAVLFLILAYFLKSIRVFTMGFFLLFSLKTYGEEQAPSLSPEIVQKVNELQEGKLNRLEKIKLADELYRAGARAESIELYKENLPSQIDSAIPVEAYLNYGTALLDSNDLARALGLYQKLEHSLKGSEKFDKIKEAMDKNVVKYFQKEEQKKQDQKQNKSDKNNKKENDSGEGQQRKDQQSEPGKNQQEKDQKGQSGDKKKNQDEKKDQEKKDKDKSENLDQKNDRSNRPDNPDDSRDSDKKPLPPQKLPAKLKQLMSDDRQLQMRMIENGTRDLNRRKSRKSKDW